MSLRSQAEALTKLGNMATPFSYEGGLLMTRNVGPTSSWSSGTFWRTWWQGSRRMGFLNDIRPRNIGANGLIFDPALDPLSKSILIGGGAAVSGASVYGVYRYKNR
jgi:hypothetical protein